jgi:uncharacterized protein (TIGR02145 family)
MKTIINSSRRTLWFKVSIAIITCLSFLILPYCQKEELSQAPMLNMNNISPSASAKKVKLTGKVKDVDGNWYQTVKIGDQWWMAENLRTTKYNDRTDIPLVIEGATWIGLTTPAYCWYDNDANANADIYGALYNWYAVNTGKLCPTGWHVPKENEDWAVLQEYLIANGYNYDGTTSENKIAKSLAATTYWYPSTETGAPGNTDFPEYRNKSGFSALPGGQRDFNGGFSNLTYAGNWWSSSMYDDTHAYDHYLSMVFVNLGQAANLPIAGFSVRCIKDK